MRKLLGAICAILVIGLVGLADLEPYMKQMAENLQLLPEVSKRVVEGRLPSYMAGPYFLEASLKANFIFNSAALSWTELSGAEPGKWDAQRLYVLAAIMFGLQLTWESFNDQDQKKLETARELFRLAVDTLDIWPGIDQGGALRKEVIQTLACLSELKVE